MSQISTSLLTTLLLKANVVLMVVVSLLLGGCTPRIEIAASKEPITINMNVKIEHEIHIKVDKDVEELLKEDSGLF